MFDPLHLAFISGGGTACRPLSSLRLFYHSNGALSPGRPPRVSAAPLGSPFPWCILSTSIPDTQADLTHNQPGREGEGLGALTGLIMRGPWRRKGPH